MKTLIEHLEELDRLEERALRTGAIASYAAQSKRQGDESVRAFKKGQQALRIFGDDIDLEDRIKRIETALDHLLDGLINQRLQIGSGVAVDVIGHTAGSKVTR